MISKLKEQDARMVSTHRRIMKRRLKLAKEYKKVCIFMLDRYPSSDHWNEQLRQINELIRKLK